MEKKRHYNIMTSCDEGLLPQLLVLLYSIGRNLNHAITDFYFLHRGIAKEKLKIHYALCAELKNVKFHDIKVPNAEQYDEMVKFGGGWAGEAYYSLCAHLLLPESVDRVLYLDAGDTLVLHDIGPYYNGDFEGKSIIATSIRYKMNGSKLVPMERDDLQDIGGNLPGILRGIFNSGSYVMNLEQMRKDGLSVNDYLYLVQTLRSVLGEESEKIYWGDQGLLSAAFVGDIKYYGYPEIADLWYMPYNFCVWYYDRVNVKPGYAPAVLHFAGAFKPWKGNYPIMVSRFQPEEGLHELSELKIGQAEHYYLWHEYAVITDFILQRLGL